jgi:DNA-binding transcriptional ArsR family regulator
VFTVVEDKPILLPMLRFSFSKLISEKKAEILKVLLNGSIGFVVLAKKVKVSLPLLSYHLNGNRDTSGLIELGLVDTSSMGKGKQASLSTLGKFFVKGYLQ